jgi:hypothetical protein
MAYTWNEGAGRFVDGRGRFVSESAVRSVVDDVADAASSRMQAASEALLDGRMSLGAWQAEISRLSSSPTRRRPSSPTAARSR